jgi:hypothetical protein
VKIESGQIADSKPLTLQGGDYAQAVQDLNYDLPNGGRSTMTVDAGDQTTAHKILFSTVGKVRIQTTKNLGNS